MIDLCTTLRSTYKNRLDFPFKDELKSVDKWLTENKLALSAEKFEFLLLGSRKRIKDAVVPDVTIRARKIQRVSYLRYLGIMI